MNFLKKIFNRSPLFLQGLERIVYLKFKKPIWKNPIFIKWYNFLEQSQWWPKEKLEEYQMQQLQILLNHAYQNVPYYRKVFDERGLKPKDIQDFDDLKKLPYLTKDEFRKSFNNGQIISKNFNLSKLPVSHTSGTTGKPLQFFNDIDANIKEWAFICHQWARVGYRPGDKRIELRGAINRKNPISFSPISNVLRFSPVIENKERVKLYLKKIREFGAEFLHGYPGAMASFALLIKRYRLNVPFKLKAILSASENIFAWERKIMKDVFNCRVFSHYGCAERTILAAEYEKSQNYHCLPQYGITEFDPETNEIIATGLMNTINPFIRYRMTDVALNPRFDFCKECGRDYYPVFDCVEGRLEDFIVTSQGSLIAPAIITHPFKDLKTIKNTQIVQNTPKEIVLRIVPWEGTNKEFLNKEISFLSYELRKIMGEEVKIKSEVVNKIKLSPSGKFKWIISKITN